MSHAIAGLRAGVAAILAAQGDFELSTIVQDAEVELVGAPDVWSLGSRTAVAHRVALILEAAAFVELRRDPARREAVRDAFAAAMRSPGTELAELALVLKLPGIAQPWRRAYREAVPRQTPERPGDAAVLAGAAALLEAAGDPEGAAALRRATLESAPIPNSPSVPLLRYVVRLAPADLVQAQRDADRAARWCSAVQSAGTRAVEAVSSVDLAVTLDPV